MSKEGFKSTWVKSGGIKQNLKMFKLQWNICADQEICRGKRENAGKNRTGVRKGSWKTWLKKKLLAATAIFSVYNLLNIILWHHLTHLTEMINTSFWHIALHYHTDKTDTAQTQHRIHQIKIIIVVGWIIVIYGSGSNTAGEIQFSLYSWLWGQWHFQAGCQLFPSVSL